VVVAVIKWVIEAYVVVLLVRAILSWFPDSSGSVLRPLQRGLTAVTEPVLAPVRRVIPPVRLGGGYLDLSLLVVIIVLEILVRLI
jgi:YggT family protein